MPCLCFRYQILKRNGFPCQGKGHTGLDEFVATLQSSKFSWSPPGHGWSNHREWEILISGSVPVVEYHPNMLEVYRGLPVVQVRRKNVFGEEGRFKREDRSTQRSQVLLYSQKENILVLSFESCPRYAMLVLFSVPSVSYSIIALPVVD